ncbi:MAG: sugar transferase [Bacteroidales bacterium]|nr:sugar transferase [Bacteroidales bacterium]
MKRFLDVILSALVLVILLPLFIIISIIIACESRGGVIYAQTRVGRYNKDFKLLKFRTMHTGSDQKGLITVGEHDSRITPFGYFLRKSKMDEFPQLLNIIKGDMSIVGPRPEVRHYVDMYTEEQMKVLSVRPGLTDFASLVYIDENKLLEDQENPEEFYIKEMMPRKLELNLKYIEQQSVKTDTILIFKTLKAIVSGKRLV